jgi:hypothetical protein
MGRPSKKPSERVVKCTISFDPDLLRRVRERCAEENVTIASFFARAAETELGVKKPDVREDLYAIQEAVIRISAALK